MCVLSMISSMQQACSVTRYYNLNSFQSLCSLDLFDRILFPPAFQLKAFLSLKSDERTYIGVERKAIIAFFSYTYINRLHVLNHTLL